MLLFSQFKMLLDLLEDYVRLRGSTPNLDPSPSPSPRPNPNPDPNPNPNP